MVYVILNYFLLSLSITHPIPYHFHSSQLFKHTYHLLKGEKNVTVIFAKTLGLFFSP